MGYDDDAEAPDSVVPHTNALAGLSQFLRAAWMRKRVVLFALFVTGVLGALYYVTAIPLYESTAQVLIVSTHSNALEANSSSPQLFQNMLPTYVEVVNSDKVLDQAADALPTENRLDLKGIPPDFRATTLRKQLSVIPSKKGNTIEIRYRSRDPKTAAITVSAILDAYVKEMESTHQSDAHRQLALLEQLRRQIEDQLAAKRNELIRLRSESQIMIGPDQMSVSASMDRLTKLNQFLVNAQQAQINAQAFYNSLRDAMARGANLDQFAQQEMEAVTRMLMMRELNMSAPDGTLFIKAQQDLLQLQKELADKEHYLGENNPAIRELKTKIAQINEFLRQKPQAAADEARRMRTELIGPKLLEIAEQKLLQASNEVQVLRQTLAAEEKMAVGVNHQMAQIADCERSIQRLETQLDGTLNAITNTDLSKFGGLRISLITPPRVSSKPVSPRLSNLIVVCLSVGIGTGLLIVYVIDMLDDRFRSPEEMRRQLGIPVLAVVRAMPPSDESGIRSVQTFARPNAVESEAFRSLRTTLSLGSEYPTRIAASSTEPGDGKTTVMANLCVAFAQSGKKTLVIDGDMRRPGMTTLLDLKGTAGLSSILRDRRPIAECVGENLFQSGATNLDVIPSGPRPMNPAELLASDRFSELLAWAETTYEQIVVDAPPSLAVTDPTIIGRLVDGIVLVVRPDKNRRRLVIRAAETFTSVGIRVLGLVANHVSGESSGDFSYGYGYGYGQDYGHSEQDEDADTDDDLYDDDDDDYEEQRVTTTRRRPRRAA